MKSFSLCHEIILPVVLKSFGLSQDLPLSQNGQNFQRKNWGMGPMGIDGDTEATGLTGANGKWVKLHYFNELSVFC